MADEALCVWAAVANFFLVKSGMLAFRGSLRRSTAGDQNYCAGDEACLFGAQIDGEFGNFVGLSKATRGNLRQKLRAQFCVLHQRRVDLGVVNAGTDAVDGNFVRSEFEGERARETEQ